MPMSYQEGKYPSEDGETPNPGASESPIQGGSSRIVKDRQGSSRIVGREGFSQIHFRMVARVGMLPSTGPASPGSCQGQPHGQRDPQRRIPMILFRTCCLCWPLKMSRLAAMEALSMEMDPKSEAGL